MPPADIQTASLGRTQRGVRDHNERLVMSILKRQGPMPGSDLARVTGLSAQTVSLILRSLQNDGLLQRGEPVRGKVGKPSVPMGIAPDGAYSIGLKIGRRSADLTLANIAGDVIRQVQTTYQYPMPNQILAFLKDGLADIYATLPPDQHSRICGVGIARPDEIWSWHESIGAAQSDLTQWRDLDFAAAISEFSDLPVFVDNDCTAASRAEHIHGNEDRFSDYAYIFVGFFIGGGVILNDSVFDGSHGRAGALGPMPAKYPDGSVCQLMDAASLITLEKMLIAQGRDSESLWAQPQDWSEFEPIIEEWIMQTAEQLAETAITLCSVIDFEAVVIDGGFPPDVRSRLVAAINVALESKDARGVIRPKVTEGAIGHNARAVGAAAAPILAQYLIDNHGR